MKRFFMALVILLAACSAKADDCLFGQCARVATAPVRVAAPVVRAVVAAPVRIVERAAPVAREVVAAPVRIVGNVIENSAQRHAERLAASGSFYHSHDRGGAPYEGLGFSTTSPDDACRRACFWGRRPVRQIGTAWCPVRRGWVAVVEYN